MSAPELIAAAGAGAGIGGAVAALGGVLTARKKAPAEVDNLIVNGAQTTVSAALAVAAAEAERADRAEAQVRERDAHIEALLGRVEILQAALDGVRDELYAIRTTTKTTVTTATATTTSA